MCGRGDMAVWSYDPVHPFAEGCNSRPAAVMWSVSFSSFLCLCVVSNVPRMLLQGHLDNCVDLGRSGPFPLISLLGPLFVCAYTRSLIWYPGHGSSYTQEADRKASLCFSTFS